MKKLFLAFLIICFMTPVSVGDAFMTPDKAAESVQKIVEGKASPWAVRDPRVKVKPKPIIAKQQFKKANEQRSIVDNPVPSAEQPPKFVDLRKFDSPIKNQGEFGYCTAFANVAVIENYANQKGVKLDLSERYLWSLYQEYDTYVATQAAVSNLIIPEKDWPYNSDKATVKGYKKNGVAGLKAYTEIQAVDQAIKALDQNKPIVFAAETTPYWGSPNKGVIPIKGAEEGGHAIAIVGYYLDPSNEATGGGFFIFKNSWGPDWGDKGYGYLPFKYCKKYSCYLIETDGPVLK
jgi:C1A family cysteine protease